MDEMKDLETDLDIELYGLNEQEAMNPDYPVKNEEDAEFVVGQIIRLQKEMEPIGAARDDKISKILSWYECKTKQIADELERRKVQLMLYADTQLALSHKNPSFFLLDELASVQLTRKSNGMKRNCSNTQNSLIRNSSR